LAKEAVLVVSVP